MYTNEESPWTWSPSRPDIDVETTPDTNPLRRLEPARICPDQQRDLIEKVIKILP